MASLEEWGWMEVVGRSQGRYGVSHRQAGGPTQTEWPDIENFPRRKVILEDLRLQAEVVSTALDNWNELRSRVDTAAANKRVSERGTDANIRIHLKRSAQ